MVQCGVPAHAYYLIGEREQAQHVAEVEAAGVSVRSVPVPGRTRHNLTPLSYLVEIPGAEKVTPTGEQVWAAYQAAPEVVQKLTVEIGRASCRERV